MLNYLKNTKKYEFFLIIKNNLAYYGAKLFRIQINNPK